MEKKLTATLLAVAILFAMIPLFAFSIDKTIAVPTASTVFVNGEEKQFKAYEINGNNYFMLRDLAYTLSGQAKGFDVRWEKKTGNIYLTKGQAYIAVGGEMTSSDNIS